MITYQKYPNTLANFGIGVFLDSKLVGFIEKAPAGGYRYAVKGAPKANRYGDTFQTIGEVKRSIEGR